MLRRPNNTFRSSVRKERMRQSTIVGIVSILVALFFMVLGVYATRIVSVVGTPMLRVGALLRDRRLVSASRETLVDHIKDLQYERQVYTSLGRQIAVLKDENERLRTLLSIRSDTEVFSRVASVVVRPPQTPYGLIVLDAGSKDGVAPGDSIRIANREHIGVVISVSDTSSKVQLYSAPDTEIPVMVGDAPTVFTAKGQSGSWRIEVPHAFEVEIGDVLTSASSSRMIYGYVTTIDEHASEPFSDVYAAPRINIQELSWVDIVRYE